MCMHIYALHFWKIMVRLTAKGKLFKSIDAQSLSDRPIIIIMTVTEQILVGQGKNIFPQI